MEEIYEIQKAIFTEDYQEDIEESMNQLLEQIDLIATNVGLDEDSQEPSPKQDSNPMHINITNQNTNISMQSQVSNLYREFNEELDKPDPDKMKLKDIVSTIIKVLGLVLWVLWIFSTTIAEKAKRLYTHNFYTPHG